MEVTELPEEVWLHVFHFLSYSEKCSIRSSCTFFKRLIDRPVLWKNTTVHLEKLRFIKNHFWRTLGNRRIKSVVVQKADEKEWAQLASRLPWLQSLTVNVCCSALHSLGDLRHLKRLVLRRCCCPSLTALTSLHLLSDLCLCEVTRAPRSDISNAVCHLTNLTSLHYHESRTPLSTAALHNILQCLPNLQHLSLKMGSNQYPVPSDYFCPAQTNHISENLLCTMGSLLSLELLNYMDPVLPPTGLQGLTSLKCLTVHYRGWAQEPKPCHLKTWLSTLPVLSELNISMGYQLGVYAKSVPATVHRLSLKHVMGELQALQDVALQVPDLQHLHLDLCFQERQSLIANVPKFFPKLQSLAVSEHPTANQRAPTAYPSHPSLTVDARMS
ncbi:uncharacterized protein im:7136021 isoform X2 [Trichomycterus rosablanca]|uniref:uncharacterized protein im:7136021 isoform X2 n=1 Tax=Trichomycterus rosablanca TaxID=2290929 RepID=UPI002F35815E